MPMEVILLERVNKLGAMGDKVRVKPGFARNYLLPQGKALRATPANIAYFEAQRSALEKQNAEKRADAEKVAKKIEGLKVSLIRNASEGGHLYGSVTSRDIADAAKTASKVEIARNAVVMNQSFKTVGLFPVEIVLHPEVRVEVTVNIARSEEEAKIQAKTGKALIVDPKDGAQRSERAVAKDNLLEASAIEAEKAEQAQEAEEAGKKAAKAATKAAKRAAKKSAAAEGDVAPEEAEGGNT